jgi:hypothetical protein
MKNLLNKKFITILLTLGISSNMSDQLSTIGIFSRAKPIHLKNVIKSTESSFKKNNTFIPMDTKKNKRELSSISHPENNNKAYSDNKLTISYTASMFDIKSTAKNNNKEGNFNSGLNNNLNLRLYSRLTNRYSNALSIGLEQLSLNNTSDNLLYNTNFYLFNFKFNNYFLINDYSKITLGIGMNQELMHKSEQVNKICFYSTNITTYNIGYNYTLYRNKDILFYSSINYFSNLLDNSEISKLNGYNLKASVKYNYNKNIIENYVGYQYKKNINDDFESQERRLFIGVGFSFEI